MAAPRLIDAGTGATDAGGAWTYTCQASGAAGRVFIVQILQDGSTNGAVTVTGATNIEDLAGTDNAWTQIPGANADGSFPVGASGEARQFLYIGRALSTSAPTISGGNSTSEDLYIRSYQFADVSIGTTLATVIENATAGSTVNNVGTSATADDASVQTLGLDRLALNFVAVNDDNLISVFTGESGGDWKLFAAPYAEASGTDGALGLQLSYNGIVGYFGEGGAQSVSSVQGTGGLNEMQAQSFLSGPGGTVGAVLVNITKTGSPTDNLIVEIQTNSGGLPSGTVVGTSGQVSGVNIPSTPTAYALVGFPVTATLSASTTYHLVVRRAGTRDTSNYYDLWGTNPGTYADGQNISRTNGSWAASGTGDTAFFLQPAGGGTISGGTGSIVDIDAWGVVGFALIGTTVEEIVAPPRYGYVNYQDPGVF